MPAKVIHVNNPSSELGVSRQDVNSSIFECKRKQPWNELQALLLQDNILHRYDCSIDWRDGEYEAARGDATRYTRYTITANITIQDEYDTNPTVTKSL